MATSTNCPRCGKVLKSIRPIPPGTMLTCPQCSQQFESSTPAEEAPGPINDIPPPLPSSPQPTTNSGSSFLDTARKLSLQFLENVRLTAIATAGHLKQLVACLMGRGRIRTAQREAVRQRAALGQKMYEKGLGDADSRRIIDDVQRRISNAQAAGHSKRALQQELLAAHAAVGEAALNGGQEPATGLEREFEAARSARDSLLAAQQTVTDRDTSLRGIQSSQGLRIVVGYAGTFLILASMIWAGTRSTGVSSGKPPSEVVDNNSGVPDEGGGVDVGGGNPAPEIIENQAPAGQQTCQNCYGTGQADCLQCFGTGKRTCFNCNGSGRTVNNMQCFQCNGTGRQNCSFCTYGKVQCPQCFGSGKR